MIFDWQHEYLIVNEDSSRHLQYLEAQAYLGLKVVDLAICHHKLWTSSMKAVLLFCTGKQEGRISATHTYPFLAPNCPKSLWMYTSKIHRS